MTAITKLRDATRDKLKGVSTATLASALYKRGLRIQMIQDVRPLSVPKGGSMVGEAYTLRYMPAREDLNPMTVFRDHAHPQRRAVEECPRDGHKTLGPYPPTDPATLDAFEVWRKQTGWSQTGW